MATKKKKTPEQLIIEKEYKRERRKVLRRVRDISKRGYSIPTNFVPNIPQTITQASIRNIQKFTTDYIYKHSVFVSPEGTIKKGYVARKEERSVAAKKGVETRKQHYQQIKLKEPKLSKEPSEKPVERSFVIMMTIEDLIYYLDYRNLTAWSTELQNQKDHDAGMMRKMLDDAIALSGRDAVLQRINENASTIYEILDAVIYESGEDYRLGAREGTVNSKIMQFGEIIKGTPLTVSESQYYTELAEQQHTFNVRE